ncbi:MAG: peptide MFS transporter [bacterium]
MSTETAINNQSLKQPKGLSTLFFTEFWERMSYYGMRALLVLFMTTSASNGGLSFEDSTATAIYGIYTAAVYFMCLPGGWIADRLIGQQKSVFYGGIIISAGHITMSLPAFLPIAEHAAFFSGLVLIVLGTGLLKPNVSSIVGELYGPHDARRDAGFTIFYMGINLGAFVAPLIIGYLGQKVDWHYGFGAAGIGMILGVLQYRLGSKHLGEAGLHPHPSGLTADKIKMIWLGIGLALLALLTIMLLTFNGSIEIPAVKMAQYTKYFIITIAALFFLNIYIRGKLDSEEKKRVFVIAALFIGAALFWSGFEQAGSSLNLFADRKTDLLVMGWEIPSTWFQSVNAFFIVALGPFFAAMWVKLATRNMEPSTPLKFAFGLILLGLGFLVMVFAAKVVANGELAAPFWLILTYFLHTTGELCLSPVGLSAVTKLAPKRFTSQMMGIWFMGASLGSVLAGLIAGDFDSENVATMPDMFMGIVQTSVGVGIIFLVLTPWLKKWSVNTHQSKEE